MSVDYALDPNCSCQEPRLEPPWFCQACEKAIAGYSFTDCDFASFRALFFSDACLEVPEKYDVGEDGAVELVEHALRHAFEDLKRQVILEPLPNWLRRYANGWMASTVCDCLPRHPRFDVPWYCRRCGKLAAGVPIPESDYPIFRQLFIRLARNTVPRFLDGEPTDDIVEEGLYKAFTKLSSYNATGPLAAWVRTVVRNHFYDRTRPVQNHRKRFVPTDPDELRQRPEFNTPKPVVAEEGDRLNWLRLYLDPNLFKIAYLHLVEGFTLATAADLLGWREGQARHRWAKAKVECLVLLEFKQWLDDAPSPESPALKAIQAGLTIRQFSALEIIYIERSTPRTAYGALNIDGNQLRTVLCHAVRHAAKIWRNHQPPNG